MKRPLQALLIYGLPTQQLCRSGVKKISIREGHRAYTPGSVMLGCDITEFCLLRNITNVRYTILKDLTEQEIFDNGFCSLQEALNELRFFYPALTLNSQVTVIRWE